MVDSRNSGGVRESLGHYIWPMDCSLATSTSTERGSERILADKGFYSASIMPGRFFIEIPDKSIFPSKLQAFPSLSSLGVKWGMGSCTKPFDESAALGTGNYSPPSFQRLQCTLGGVGLLMLSTRCHFPHTCRKD